MLARPAGLAWALAVFAVVSTTPTPLRAQAAERPARVLLLFQQQEESQPMVEFAQQLRRSVRAELGAPVEFYQEALDADRFRGRERSPRLSEYFRDKYGAYGIDVVVPVGSRALKFAVEQLRDVLPGVPVVFALSGAPQTDTASLPAHVTGRLAAASRFAPTVTMARSLQPEAERVVVVGGAGATDSVAVAAAVAAVRAARVALPVEIVQGLSLDALLPRLHQIPRRSIVIFANYRHDAHGQAFEPLDIVGTIANAAAAPMYTQLRSYVGTGVVGGSVTHFDDEGRRTGNLIVRVLRRRAGDRLPPVEIISTRFVADWRQLARWELSEQRLPAGTEVLFREPTLWQRYRNVVLLTLVIVIVESMLIGGLLLERRLRKRAQSMAEEQQRQLEETRRQVTHMGRVALVGELAAAIAHELRQPLAAIRANAEIGAKLASGGSWEVGAEEREIYAEIFSDIVRDDGLASEVVTRVRALLRREEMPQQEVDVNDVCRTAARLIQHDATTRNAKITLSLAEGTPVVIGDPVQLQQVVLNLAVNALDATASTARPHIMIVTAAREAEVEVVVHDNGPGFSPDVQQRLFESFFTTKPHGLGLGLVIVQSIVERHHGRVEAENGRDGGAVFRLVMPRRHVVRPTVLSGGSLPDARRISSSSGRASQRDEAV